MGMANTATTAGTAGAPVAQLKTKSVWLVVGDDDVVLALDEITSLQHHAAPAAA